MVQVRIKLHLLSALAGEIDHYVIFKILPAWYGAALVRLRYDMLVVLCTTVLALRSVTHC